MTGQRIVVVEDEPVIAEAVADRLRSEGYTVDVAGDGPSAVATCERVQPDLVVLDLMLPGFDGLEVCRRVQAERRVPVLMLTARDDETDLIVGLAVGADDYMTKPFSMRELVARVSALLRRVDSTQPATPPGSGNSDAANGSARPELDGDILRVRDVVIDRATRLVHRGEEPVHLTPTEFDLLCYLAESPGVVRTRAQMLVAVWGYRDGTGGRTVDSHVRALRRKLGDDLIRTVHGVGYAIDDPTQ